MVPVIASPRSESAPARGEAGWTARDRLQWSGRISLTRRILTVNIVALVLLAGGFFYLDSFRSRIIDGRVEQARREARLIAEAGWRDVEWRNLSGGIVALHRAVS